MEQDRVDAARVGVAGGEMARLGLHAFALGGLAGLHLDAQHWSLRAGRPHAHQGGATVAILAGAYVLQLVSKWAIAQLVSRPEIRQGYWAISRNLFVFIATTIANVGGAMTSLCPNAFAASASR